MKKFLLAVAAGSMLWVAGCVSPTSGGSQLADLGSDPEASAKWAAAFGAFSDISFEDGQSIAGVTITGDSSDCTVTFTDYSPDDGHTVLNGSIRLRVSASGDTTTIQESGSIALSGDIQGTVSIDFTMTMNSATMIMTMKGTIGVDGTNFSLDEEADLSGIPV